VVKYNEEELVAEREIKDRIYRIASHVKDAIHAIIEHTRDKILREHVMLPIHAAREFDSISVKWLSRKPGRTVREKLLGRPYIKAVKRKTSIDTSENRLLKAFMLRFEQILIERQKSLNSGSEETCEDLLITMQRWLRNEDSVEIGNWGNLPPNNILLQDKHYRKVWDAWLCFQCIDENIDADHKRISQDILIVIYWKLLSMLNKTGLFRTVQQPLTIDYDNFVIDLLLPIKGYLFPKIDSKLMGKINFINYEKKFGFLTTDTTDLFFHKNNLSRGLELDTLKVGDDVSFEIGQNRQGECSNNIYLITGPEIINLNLLCDQIVIDFRNNSIIVRINTDCITVVQKPKGYKKRFELQFSTCKEVPNTILSLILDEIQISLTKAHNNNQKGSIQTDMSVVDLCSIRPRFTNNKGTQSFLPFRLLQQSWPVDPNEDVLVDCGSANAITLRSDIETVSMRSLFLPNSTLSDAAKSNASMFFMKKLKDHISTNMLSYLVPDWGNDFDLESIRKSVNFYFGESIPLPKSIAAIFAWQSSKRFNQDKIRDNDLVLVVDAFSSGISITPVQAIYRKELIDILPETRGICWERHPTLIINNKEIHLNIVRNLCRDGCLISDELIHLFGFDGLVSDAGNISFVNNENWYHLPTCIREVLNCNLDENVLSLKNLSDCMHSLKGKLETSDTQQTAVLDFLHLAAMENYNVAARQGV